MLGLHETQETARTLWEVPFGCMVLTATALPHVNPHLQEKLIAAGAALEASSGGQTPLFLVRAAAGMHCLL